MPLPNVCDCTLRKILDFCEQQRAFDDLLAKTPAAQQHDVTRQLQAWQRQYMQVSLLCTCLLETCCTQSNAMIMASQVQLSSCGMSGTCLRPCKCHKDGMARRTIYVTHDRRVLGLGNLVAPPIWHGTAMSLRGMPARCILEAELESC